MDPWTFIAKGLSDPTLTDALWTLLKRSEIFKPVPRLAPPAPGSATPPRPLAPSQPALAEAAAGVQDFCLPPQVVAAIQPVLQALGWRLENAQAREPYTRTPRTYHYNVAKRNGQCCPLLHVGDGRWATNSGAACDEIRALPHVFQKPFPNGATLVLFSAAPFHASLMLMMTNAWPPLHFEHRLMLLAHVQQFDDMGDEERAEFIRTALGLLEPAGAADGISPQERLADQRSIVSILSQLRNCQDKGEAGWRALFENAGLEDYWKEFRGSGASPWAPEDLVAALQRVGEDPASRKNPLRMLLEYTRSLLLVSQEDKQKMKDFIDKYRLQASR